MTCIRCSQSIYKGKVYRFMVNGQSGETRGESPTSAWRVLGCLLLVGVGIILLYVGLIGGVVLVEWWSSGVSGGR